MRKIKRFAVGLVMALTAALLAVGATGCTEKGDREYTEHVCSWTISSVTEATCTTDAVATFTCSDKNCSQKKTETVRNSKLGHNEVTFTSIPATCTQPGYREMKKCTRCDAVTYSDFRIEPTGHDTDFSNKNSRKANCQQGAYCGDCNSYYGERRKDHETDLLVYNKKAATCVEDGWDEYVRCQYQYSDGTFCTYSTQEIKEKLGHDGEKGSVADYLTSRPATCVELGYCGRCNEYYGDYNAHDTNYNKTSAKYCGSEAAVCGLSKAYCGVCSRYYGEFPNHDLDTHDAVEPTCDAIGNYAYVSCKNKGCYYTTYQEIPALGHKTEKIAKVEPTCTTTGWDEGLHCLNCYKVLAQPVIIPALGHDGERANQKTERDLLHEDSFLPDCTHGGYCGFCGEMYGSGKVTGKHDLVTVPAQAATCQMVGWKEYIKCQYCHYSTYEENVLPSVDHDPRIHEAIEPTCTTPGYVEWYGCIYCMTRPDPTIPAKGHDGENGPMQEADSRLPSCEDYGYCGICDSYYGEHNNGHVQGVPPTCTTPAICEECGLEYGDPYGHRFIDDVCVYCGDKKEN